MKKFFLCFYFTLFGVISHAQNMNSIWCFGDSTGIDFTDTINPIALKSSSLSRGSCTGIADSSGLLLFYANTLNHALWSQGFKKLTVVHNANGNIMQNGDSIIGEGWYHELTIIPKPGSNHIYYLFSIGIVFSTLGFYYSLIDMSLNGGLGAVTQKNVQLNSFRNADCVTAIKHGNGRDWWVISKFSDMSSTSTNEFDIYLITKDSIAAPLIQTFNNVTNSDLHALEFNSSGDKLMQSNRAGFLCQYDFDRCTGIISNSKIIYSEQQSNFNRNIFDQAFSPNDSLLYVSTGFYTNIDTSYLIQYDLTATNIPASADTLGKVTWPVQGGAVRLAPDNKIYYTCFYDWGFPGYPYPDSVHNMYNENLGVINFPDSLGAKCDYQPFSFYLGGKRTYYGLPNNPNYELGPLVGSPCDTLSAATPKPPTGGLNTGVLQCTYISNWNKLFINASGVKGKDVTVSIYDARGSLKFEVKSLKNNAGYVTLDVDCGAAGSPSGAGGTGWSNGIYIVNLLSEKESLSCKFVKQ